MKFIDAAGNELVEGTQVSFPLSFGHALPGTIAKLESGIGIGAQSIPRLCIMFVLPLAAGPDGHVAGVFAMPQPQAVLT